jgi:3,4-dihydroxy 2-butanone 4-phosphate synthase/GTP cyclohydrolase II
VDLTRLAGLKPSGVICEIMNEDGSMARLPELEKFIKQHDLKLCSIADIIEYRRHHEKLVERVVTVKFPTLYGEFDLHVYKSKVDEHLHLAVCRGIPIRSGSQPRLKDPVLVRVHSECLTGDLFGSNLCDCGAQLDQALKMIVDRGAGVLLYMRQEGRGIGLEAKLKAYHLQQTEGMDTIEANQALGFPPDVRDYGIGAQILADLGVRQMELMTNNPKKYHGLKGYGLEIVKRVSLEIPPTKENFRYLQTKKERMGHLLKNGDLAKKDP